MKTNSSPLQKNNCGNLLLQFLLGPNPNFFKLILLAALAITALSCEKDSTPILSDQAELINFTIQGQEATISGNDISLTLPHNTNPKSLTAQTTLSKNAGIKPDPSQATDYSTPVSFTVTAEDGSTTKKYTVTINIAAATPSAANPYPQGVFVLRWLQGTNYELDFKHATGALSSKVFQKTNAGKKIDDRDFTDIIPHKNGYLIFTNLLDGSGGVLYFTDLQLKIRKEVKLDKANVLAHKYAQINNKVYYTNVSDNIEVNQPENKVYIIDTATESLKDISAQYMQFFTDNTNQLYGLDIAGQLNHITDLNTIQGSKLAEFEQNYSNFYLDDHNRLWNTFNARQPSTIHEALQQGRGTFDYRLNLVCYDLNTKTKYTGSSVKAFNRNSLLFQNDGKVYTITNQNSHLSNPKKELQELYLDGNTVKLKARHQLPKIQGSAQQITNDLNGLHFFGNTMAVFGSDNNVAAPNGIFSYYYTLDMSTGAVSDKTLGISALFMRKAL